MSKIAILGGGMAALTAAFELTRPQLEKEHEVTIYQMGWRLGGKCATGRGPNDRVEEHGIHLFGGGYYNALTTMKECYDELNQAGIGWTERFEDVFEDQYLAMSFDHSVGPEPRVQSASLPRSPVDVADIRQLASIGNVLGQVVRWLNSWYRQTTFGLERLVALVPSSSMLLRGADPGVARFTEAFVPSMLDQLEAQFRAESPDALQTLDRLSQRVEGAAEISSLFERRLLSESADLSAFRTFTFNAVNDGLGLAKFVFVLLRAAGTELIVNRRSYDDLDAQNYDDWLVSYGLNRAEVLDPLVQAPLRILYQFPDGDSTRPGSMGAGAYLHWTLRTFAYVRSPFWFFKYGTGDTVVLALYEALKVRGVRFEFFHRVKALRLSDDKKSVDKVDLDIQAMPENGGPYDPLITVNNRHCWPGAPNYDQLHDGAKLAERPADELESYWSDWCVKSTTLKRGEHFDHLVFAISLGAVPVLCKELLNESSAWRDMVEHIKTVETQSMQIWLSKTSKELGSPAIDPRDPDDTGLGCGFEKPFDGLSDFSPVIEHERWPEGNKPQALWYFSDVLVGGKATGEALLQPGYPEDRKRDVVKACKAFLQELRPVLKNAFDAHGFMYSLLVTPTVAANDTARLSQQHIRANVQPSDRYVTAPANTTQFRIEPKASGFAGLVLAGDWTYNGLNLGCVEAAVMSGKLASQAICGFPLSDDIVGYTGRK